MLCINVCNHRIEFLTYLFIYVLMYLYIFATEQWLEWIFVNNIIFINSTPKCNSAYFWAIWGFTHSFTFCPVLPRFYPITQGKTGSNCPEALPTNPDNNSSDLKLTHRNSEFLGWLRATYYIDRAINKWQNDCGLVSTHFKHSL